MLFRGVSGGASGAGLFRERAPVGQLGNGQLPEHSAALLLVALHAMRDRFRYPLHGAIRQFVKAASTASRPARV